jgi:hypothetical protein
MRKRFPGKSFKILKGGKKHFLTLLRPRPLSEFLARQIESLKRMGNVKLAGFSINILKNSIYYFS